MKNLSSNVVSVVILNCIKQNFQLEYEDWEKRIGKEIKYFEGFIAISNKKLEGVNNEYFTIFQFDTPYNLNKWQNSNTLKRFLNEMKKYTLSESKVSQHEGLEIFFDKTQTTISSTPFYKKVVIGVIAVYPLIIVIDKLYQWLNPWAESIPFELGLFFQVIVISVLMTYPVMPILTRVFCKCLAN